jgi:hypothetical protein
MVENGISFRTFLLYFLQPRNDMIALSDYAGREQSYVKHVFLERYLERLVHKTASAYSPETSLERRM